MKDMTNFVQELTERKMEITNKIRNIDTATIKNINNKITQAKLSLINKLEKNATDNELLSKENATKYLNNKGIDFNLGNRPYLKKELDDIINAQPAKTNQKQSANTFYSNKTKYAVPDIKKVTEPFETQQEYSKEEISKIWNYEIVENEYDVIYDTNNNIISICIFCAFIPAKFKSNSVVNATTNLNTQNIAINITNNHPRQDIIFFYISFCIISIT